MLINTDISDLDWMVYAYAVIVLCRLNILDDKSETVKIIMRPLDHINEGMVCS